MHYDRNLFAPQIVCEERSTKYPRHQGSNMYGERPKKDSSGFIGDMYGTQLIRLKIALSK